MAGNKYYLDEGGVKSLWNIMNREFPRLDESDKVPSRYLPSYVDDVVEIEDRLKIIGVDDTDYNDDAMQAELMAFLDTISSATYSKIEGDEIMGVYYINYYGLFVLKVISEADGVSSETHYFSWEPITEGEGDNAVVVYPGSSDYGVVKSAAITNGSVSITQGITASEWYFYNKINTQDYYALDTDDNLSKYAFESGKIYLNKSLNKTYRWSGSQLVEVGGGVALGETAETAYPGNKGKKVYDAVFAKQKSVPTPAIRISWTFQNNAGNTVEGINESTDSTNPILERGYKATYSASYSWTNSNSAKYKNPIAASGSWTTLTLDGADSEMISGTITAASTNKSVNITLSAPKTGLMISGSKVIPATGNDTASASKSVTFLPRIYYGWSDAIPTGDTAADTIKKLLNKLQNEATFNSPASKPDGTQYYVFAYPKEWGTINKILMDNADPVTTTFINNNDVKIVNAAGVEHTYYVSVTAAPQKEESFNANVSFSFYFN